MNRHRQVAFVFSMADHIGMSPTLGSHTPHVYYNHGVLVASYSPHRHANCGRMSRSSYRRRLCLMSLVSPAHFRVSSATDS